DHAAAPNAVALLESPALEVFISSKAASIRAAGAIEGIRSLKPGQWHNLQLTLDLEARTVSGTLGTPDDVVAFDRQPISQGWSGAIDFVALESSQNAGSGFP